MNFRKQTKKMRSTPSYCIFIYSFRKFAFRISTLLFSPLVLSGDNQKQTVRDTNQHLPTFQIWKFEKKASYPRLGRQKGVRIDFLDVWEILEDPCTSGSNSGFLITYTQNFVAVSLINYPQREILTAPKRKVFTTVQYRGMDTTAKSCPGLCCTYSIPLGSLPGSCSSTCIFAPHQYCYVYWVWQLTDSAVQRRASELPHLCGQPCIWWRYTSVNTSILYRGIHFWKHFSDF